ncbi:MAG: prolyl oligopeptidase family serine peptidase, partial [Janthinobacterium lividum]
LLTTSEMIMRSTIIALMLTASVPALSQPATQSAAAPAAPPAASPQATTPGRTFAPRDIFALEQASDVQISPDGKHIVYVRQIGDIMTDGVRRALWLVDCATGAQAPLIDGPGSRPRWSPDGRRLAYVAADPAGKPQLFVHWMDSGKDARITGLPEAPSDIAWSPDGRQLAFTMFVAEDDAKLGTSLPKPDGAKWADPLKIITQVHYRADGEGYLRTGYDHVFVVAADGGAPRQLTFGRFDDGGALSWSGNDSVLFSSNHSKDWEREPLVSEIFTVTVATATLNQLTSRNGPNAGPQASPDGKLIAYVGFDDRLRGYENSQLSVMNRDGSGSHVISSGLDRSVGEPRWAADGRSVFVSYDDRGVTRVARFGLDGRMTAVAEGLAGSDLDRPYSGGSYSLARTGAVAFPWGTPEHPGDVGLATAPARQRRLTRLNDDLFVGKALGKVTPMHVASSADGLMIDYWMVTPPDYDASRKYPLILEIHGGPYAAYAPVWSTEDQLYAAAGYVVVYANPRGSTSYGEAFANRIWKDYPSHDYDDLMSVVDDAVAHGPADPDNLFVTGGSGGGLLTAWIVGKTGRFKAAVAQKPVINWTSEGLTTDGYSDMLKYWFGTQPWENHELLWAHSPLSLVGNVTTPTLLMVGEEDHRTPGSEAEQFYAALQIRKIPTALIRVPGASHHSLADRPSQLAAENAAILAWFGRYRTGSGLGH